MEKYDVVIIGGGITGAGILRDCAIRGLKTLLLEKGEFGGVTTMASSRLIHGGARYLKDDYNETKICSIETGYIYRIAKPFLQKIVFLMPFFKGEAVKMELTEIGLDLYDYLGKYRFTDKHTRLSRKETLKIMPELDKSLIGALTFEEWAIDPEEFVKANIKSAAAFGAEAQQCFAVQKLIIENNEIKGVIALDKLREELAEIRAEIVINAAGPWSEKIAKLAGIDLKLRPIKGIHLVLDNPLKYGLAFKAIDGRNLIAQPRDNKLLLGTTDDDYYGDLDNLRTTEDEEKYLLEALAMVAPNMPKAQISERIVGVRPTIRQWGVPEDKVSREFLIVDHKKSDNLEGLITVCGGKMTIYRAMAEKAVDLVCQKLGVDKPCQTHLRDLLQPQGIRPEEKFDKKIRREFFTPTGPLTKIKTFGFLGVFAFIRFFKNILEARIWK